MSKKIVLPQWGKLGLNIKDGEGTVLSVDEANDLLPRFVQMEINAKNAVVLNVDPIYLIQQKIPVQGGFLTVATATQGTWAWLFSLVTQAAPGLTWRVLDASLEVVESYEPPETPPNAPEGTVLSG